jgi:hypothetical protein
MPHAGEIEAVSSECQNSSREGTNDEPAGNSRFHDGRRFDTTHLLAANKKPQGGARHNRTSMTADVYAHAIAGMQDELVSKLDEMLG